jgi:hypothetical protein
MSSIYSIYAGPQPASNANMHTFVIRALTFKSTANTSSSDPILLDPPTIVSPPRSISMHD